MRAIGFSTGAIAFGDFERALELLTAIPVTAIELSALRVSELDPLLEALDHLNLAQFQYVSFHAPSKFDAEQERRIVRSLNHVSEKRRWPIIVHPDAIVDPDVWLSMQGDLCFENMDKRKPIGRTAAELAQMFRKFPRASLCFDLGHAHQVDRTMTEGRLIGQQFADRIRQIHISEVNTRSEHVAVSAASELAFKRVLDVLPAEAPVIIESVVANSQIVAELDRVQRVFDQMQQYALIPD